MNRDPKKHQPIQPLVFFGQTEAASENCMTDEEVLQAMDRFGDAVRAFEGNK